MQLYLRYLEEQEDAKGGTTNILLKVGSLIFLLGMAIGFGFMPYFITRCRTSNKFLGYSNSFSGGIFLGMGLFHILPESAEMLEGLSKAPIAYFCAFGAYALILFVEKIAFDSHSLVHSAHCQDHEHQVHKTHENENKSENYAQEQQKEDIKSPNKGESPNKNPNIETESNKHINEAVVINIETKRSESSIKETEENKKNESETKNENETKPEINESKKIVGLSGYILLLALGFHGFFEGISLGIQQSVNGTLFLLLGVALHKWAASLTLGIAFVRSGVEKKQYVIMILIFAFITPIGISIGLVLTSTANEYVAGIFLSISVGTFIYIACSEVIVDEFSQLEGKGMKFFMFLLGAAVTAGLTLMELIDHEGGEHQHRL